MKMLKTIIIISLFLLTLFECGSRCFYKYTYSAFNIIRPNFMDLIYPELKKVNHHDGSCSVLILGESVTESSLFSKLLKYKLGDCFCTDVSIDNLSKYANTVIDSYYKYSKIKKHYDYVIMSVGLCDCRMHYNPYPLLSDSYYFSWEYIKKKIFITHHESSLIVTPMTLHLLIYWINYSLRNYGKYERKGRIDTTQYHFGKTTKDNFVFSFNVDKIISLAKSKNEKLIIVPINICIAEGYTENKFVNGLLDYGDKTEYPAEIYGDPENLEAIMSTNKKVMKQKESKNVYVKDVNIPCNGNYFRDVCHLSEKGMEVFTSDITDLICKEKRAIY